MTAILDLLSRRQQDWTTLAKSDAGVVGTFARGFACVHKGVATMADVPSDSVRVDEANMTSWWTISTSSLDREGDSLTPNGCLKTIDNYRRNPVVLLEHNALWPVGTSVGVNGWPLIIEENCIRAGLKHHDLTKEARDTFRLVQGGILRGASIAFLPLKAKQLGEVSKGSLRSPRFLFSEWDCTHWSPTTQPQNPESIRMHLSRGDIESDYFKKSLETYAEKPLIYSQGWTPEESSMATINVRSIQSIRCSKALYPTVEDAETFAKSIGFDTSMVIDRPNCHEFTQQPGECDTSKKLAKGVEAMILKAVVGHDLGDRQVPIDDTPDETPPVVQKADDGKKPADKPKGPARVTHSAHFCADIGNHIAGCKQYLTEAGGLLDHEPTVELSKQLMAKQEEMEALLKDHAGAHFSDLDMGKIGQERATAKEEEANGKKKKAVEPAEPVDESKAMEKLITLLDNRQKSLDATHKAITGAAAFQETVRSRFALN